MNELVKTSCNKMCLLSLVCLEMKKKIKIIYKVFLKHNATTMDQNENVLFAIIRQLKQRKSNQLLIFKFQSVLCEENNIGARFCSLNSFQIINICTLLSIRHLFAKYLID